MKGSMNSVKWMGLLTGGMAALTVGVVTAQAGTKDGGGGPSVICNGPDGKVATAQLLDLHEAQIRYGLTIARSSAPAEQQLKAAFDRLAAYNWYLGSDVEDALAKVESKIAFLPPGEIMAPGVDLGDSYAAVIPNGCQLAYVGYYEGDGTLRISQDIWDKLDQTNRAALFMHEALYMVARNIGNQHNSLDSREVNGYLFSTAQNLSALDSVVPDLTWKGYLNFVHPPMLAPAKVAQLATEWSVEISTVDGKNFNSSDSFLAGCIANDGSGFEYYRLSEVSPPVPSSDGTDGDGPVSGFGDRSVTGWKLPLGNCGLLDIPTSYFEEPVKITVRYGDQVIETGTVQGSGGQFYIPVYIQRQLVAPTNLPQ